MIEALIYKVLFLALLHFSHRSTHRSLRETGLRADYSEIRIQRDEAALKEASSMLQNR